MRGQDERSGCVADLCLQNLPTWKCSIGNMNSGKTARRSGPGILSKWDEPSKRRQRKALDVTAAADPTGKRFKYLAHARRYQKFGRNEPAPDLKALPILDIETGKIKPPAQTKEQQEQQEQSTPLAQEQAPAQEKLPNLGRFNPVEMRIRAASPAKDDGQQAEAAARVAGTGQFRVPATCYNWTRGQCPKSAAECPFEHYDTGVRGPHEHYVPMKFMNPPLTCWYWYNTGICGKSSDECKFAHWNTGYIAEKRRGKPREVDKPTTLAEFLYPPESQRIAARVPRNEKTCWFWVRGHCRKSAETCEFLHEDTGTVADPPASYLGMYLEVFILRGSAFGQLRFVHRKSHGEGVLASPVKPCRSSCLVGGAPAACGRPRATRRSK